MNVDINVTKASSRLEKCGHFRDTLKFEIPDIDINDILPRNIEADDHINGSVSLKREKGKLNYIGNIRKMCSYNENALNHF